MLAFGERFPAHTRIVLGRNFRCRAEILEAAVACVDSQRAAGAQGADRQRGAAAATCA